MSQLKSQSRRPPQQLQPLPQEEVPGSEQAADQGNSDSYVCIYNVRNTLYSLLTHAVTHSLMQSLTYSLIYSLKVA